jgi:hypothetical protein
MAAIKFLHFEAAQSSMDIMAASGQNMTASRDSMAVSLTIPGVQSNLKMQNFIQNELKRGRFLTVSRNFCTHFCFL